MTQKSESTSNCGQEPGARILKPGGGSEEYRYGEANRRQQVLETFAALLAKGNSEARAAKLMGASVTTLWRYRKAFERAGFNGLLPNTHLSGNKTKLEKLGVSPDVIEEIRGLNLDVKSTTGALRLFAHSDRCPENLAREILNPNKCSKHAIAPSIRQAVKNNVNLDNAHNGPRRLALKGMWTPRKNDILPGDIFSSDDTTPIWAWWVPWVECEEYPFGCKLLQGQFLPVIDVASQCIVAFVLLAREGSSYRAVDIWFLFGHTFETVGLPRLGWQLERGSWEALLIAGQSIEFQDGDLTLSRRVGGLRELPTNITDWHRQTMGEAADFFPKQLQTWTSFLPKSKSIEGWFNRNQALEGTLWGSLGRDQMRQPMEKMKKVYEACKRPRAKEDMRNYFLSQTEILLRVRNIIDYINHEPMEGEVFHGIPIQKFEQARIDHPLFVLPEEQKYLYRREWKAVQVTQGMARIRLTDPESKRYSLFYTHPEIFARHEGEEIIAYYDRENFDQPAQIHLASTGEFLCEAQYQDRRGSFLDGDSTGHDIRKRWKNAVMSAYATLVKHAPSRQLPPEIKARREESKQLERLNGSAPAPEPQPGGSGIRVVGKFPAKVQPRPALTPEEIAQRRQNLSRQAEIAKRLMAHTED